MTQQQSTSRKMDSFGPGDMALPELKLIQNVGGGEAKQSGAKPGDIYCTLTNVIYSAEKGMDIIVVDMQKTRTFWGRSDITEDPPECASLDADSEHSMNGLDCKTCPHRVDVPWLLDAAERREKCLLHYNILGLNVEDSMPLVIRASGISTKPVRELLTQLRMNRRLRNKEGQVEYHRAVVHVSSVPKKSVSGDAFAYQFKVTQLLSEPEKVKEFAELSGQLLGTVIGLPEGREPVAYEPDGTPVYEEQKTISKTGQPDVVTVVQPEVTTTAPIMKTFGDLYKVCFIMFKMQPADVVKELGYTSQNEISDTPEVCYQKILAKSLKTEPQKGTEKPKKIDVDF